MNEIILILSFWIIGFFWYLDFVENVPFGIFTAFIGLKFGYSYIFGFLWTILTILHIKYCQWNLLLIFIYLIKLTIIYENPKDFQIYFLPSLPLKYNDDLKYFFEEDFDFISKLKFILAYAEISKTRSKITNAMTLLAINFVIVFYHIYNHPKEYCFYIVPYLILEVYSYRWDFIKSYLMPYDIPYMPIHRLEFEYKEYLKEIQLTNELSKKITKNTAKIIAAYHRKIF